ncbi:hypothetical protein LXA43DRAFT_1053673 [Ganoderma leucocontextum]|nr:hypothetical protein LXA43DRAFT_1053673 [Ganoderma leucocontextum]
MAENTVHTAGQFSGNTPLTGHNIQGHSVSAILVREVPEEVLTTSVTNYGTQGMYGKPMQMTPKHDQDNERRRKWRAAQSLKREATRKANKKAQFERVSGRSVGKAPRRSNAHKPGHTCGRWQRTSDPHPPLLHGSPPPSPLVLESSPSPSIASSPSSQESTTPSANTPITQGQLLREWTPYSLPDAPSGAPTFDHAPTTSELGLHTEVSSPAHVTGPGGRYPCLGIDVYPATSRTDGPNSSQHDGPIDQGHTGLIYNGYATWTAGNSPGRHGCENFVGFPPIAYQMSTALVAGFDQHHLSTHEQHAASVYYSGGHVQPPSPYATQATIALNPHPEATYVADDSTKHFHATTPGLETDHGGRSTSSSQPPPTFWSESPEALDAPPPSAHTTSGFGPDLWTAQESERSTDSFNATYQDFFVRCSPDSRDSSGSQPPAPVVSGYYANTPQQANGGAAPQAYSMMFAFTDNTIDATAHHNTAERYPRDMSHASDTSYAARPEGGDSIAWSAPPAVTAHADRERSDHIENTMNDAYAYMQAVQVPPPSAAAEATYTMQPSLPTPQSSYSELAQALEYHPHAFFDDSAPSATDGMAITPRTMVSAVPGTALYVSLSSGALGIDASGPVPLAPSYPQDVAISEDELCARIIQECFDDNERLLSKISSLLLDMGFATEQARDAN